jgi:hypothetical protein
MEDFERQFAVALTERARPRLLSWEFSLLPKASASKNPLISSGGRWTVTIGYEGGGKVGAELVESVTGAGSTLSYDHGWKTLTSYAGSEVRARSVRRGS